MARNRGQSAADVADATRAAFHLTASAHPTKIIKINFPNALTGTIFLLLY